VAFMGRIVNYKDCDVNHLYSGRSREHVARLYNLLCEGDLVTSSTVRKVQNESATGSSTSSKVRTTLRIHVEAIDFDFM